MLNLMVLLITQFIEHSPSSEIDNCSTGQKFSSSYMESGILFSCTHWVYAVPDESSQHPHILFLKDPFSYYPVINTFASSVTSFHQDFQLKSCMHYFAMHTTCPDNLILLHLIVLLIYDAHYVIQGCIQKFPYWPPRARTANGTILCH
jgi:hypothetical protein